MDTKEKSQNFDFISFENEERTETISLVDPLDIGEVDTIEDLSWEHLRGDISEDLQLSEFRLVDVIPLERTCTSRNTENLSKAADDEVALENKDTNNPNSFSPEKIKKRFRNRNSLKFVYESKGPAEKQNEICELCNQKFSSLGRKRVHLLKTHQVKLYIYCALCDAKFFLKGEIIKHISEAHHSKTGKYSCTKCKKTYSDYRSMFLHMKSHSSYDKNSDDFDDSDIDETMERLAKKQEKNFACETCGKRFAFSCLLKDHVNLHTGLKPYLCPHCGKYFSQKASLKQHCRTHNTIRPHKCPECPQSFYGKGDLNKHMRLHTGERPYVCEMCGETFIQSSHLVAHRRIHTGERPYQCDICSRGFTKNGDVLRHRRIHTGELPYKCEVCGKAFRQSAQCKNHVKSHHPPEVMSNSISEGSKNDKL